MLLIGSEDLFANHHRALSRVFDFVGVDTAFQVKGLQPQNVASNHTRIEPQVYEYLDAYFHEPNQALVELSGQRFKW